MQLTPERHTLSAQEAHIPRVSIGMPVYNGGQYIGKALDSLLSQTHVDFELIISDNASTDATEAVCREYAGKDKRIRYVRQAKNLGAPANFSFVLDEARSEYFMWAAADDYWGPSYVQKCLTALEHDPGVAVASTKYHVLSRACPLFKMRHFPDMTFLAGEDAFARVSQFILMSSLSHKANLIYGLWRRRIAKEVTAVFRDVDPRLVHSGLDIAQLVYVLASWKAYQVPEVLFFKTYRDFPPGHVGGLILGRVVRWLRWPRRKKHPPSRLREHLDLLRTSLERAHAEDGRYEQVLQLGYELHLARHAGPKAMAREFITALKAGVV